MTRRLEGVGVVALSMMTLTMVTVGATPARAEPPAAPADPAAPTAPAATGATAAGATTPGTGEPPEEEARFRWGVSAFGGPLMGGYKGGGGGIDARFGAQINNQFGIYGQPVFLVAAGASNETTANGATASATAAAFYGVGALGDITFNDMFYLAAGPEILVGGIASASVTGTTTGGSTSGSASTGAHFSVAARAGVVLGRKKPNRRSGFQIGLDFRAILADRTAILPCLALGYEAF